MVLWESRGLPPGVFEPLGSAAVPRATATLIALLSLLVLLRALARLRRAAPPSGGLAEVAPRRLDALLVAVLTVGYVLAMQFRIVSFALMTTLFLFVCIGLLTRFRPRLLPAVALIAAAVGFGCQYLFTRVFIVDLPGL